MTDMVKDRKDRLNEIRVRLEQMNERLQSVKPLETLKLEAEELDKELRDKLRAAFIP